MWVAALVKVFIGWPGLAPLASSDLWLAHMRQRLPGLTCALAQAATQVLTTRSRSTVSLARADVESTLDMLLRVHVSRGPYQTTAAPYYAPRSF